jgi:regulation of enolase protein 1 (concanavalin A-like superfamily)
MQAAVERPMPKPSVPSEPDLDLRETGHTRVAWGEFVSPDRDCKINLDPSKALIKISVPGTPHLLSAELGRMNAPRLVREVGGDFDAYVSVAGVSHPEGKSMKQYAAPYHGAGILVWQDEANYVRLEIAADVHQGKIRPYTNFEYRENGALAASRGLKFDDGLRRLRLRRRGDEIYAAFGPDGVRWTLFPRLVVKFKDRLKVGVIAINNSTKLLDAELEGFTVSEKLSSSTAQRDRVE